MHVDLDYNFPSSFGSQAAVREIIGDWRFIAHPLRERFLKPVLDEYSGKLWNEINLPTFEQGALKTITIRTRHGDWFGGIKKLPWDSDFFGFGIGRIEPLVRATDIELSDATLSVACTLVAQLVSFAKARKLEHLIASVDPGDAIFIYALEESGFRLKDTMNFHFFDLNAIQLKEKSTSIRLGRAEDSTALGDIAFRCFGNQRYIKNRFSTDPQYPIEKVGEMYRIWIQKSLVGDRADAVFVSEHQGVPVGFLTAILPTAEQQQLGFAFGDQGVGAVDPSAHRLGTFSKLHNAVLSWFKELGINYALTRTALSTTGVNKACIRHGSTVPCSPHTFHADLRK